MTQIETIQLAAREYNDLQARRTHPAGTFDNKSRFTLETRCACCAGIRTPSAAFPYSEMVHGRTAMHVAAVHGVDAKDVRRAAKAL